ncbi:tetratricopeptide repeat protein [Helicobacter felistomachi]|uniref:tetratricopeptide repeat protein n=1 Tax=Helicobacter felistomachi TaxID=3040201 RepID=UPI0025735D68|nr:tetratricopeptide repeat protein [Helicobacter sp. NHP21005]
MAVGLCCFLGGCGESESENVSVDQYLPKAEQAYRDKDYEVALKYLEKAVRLGDAHAYAGLGVLYHNGYGVRKDYSKALDYFDKAAQMGDAGAVRNIGCMYYWGLGVGADRARAREYFKKSRQMGLKVMGLCDTDAQMFPKVQQTQLKQTF